MIINIKNLLDELISFNQSVIREPHISSEAKGVLVNMQSELGQLNANNAPNKQEKMIQLFIGTTLFVLMHEDMKYRCDFYPQNLTAQVLPPNRRVENFPEDLYQIGKNALLDLPNTFNGALFQRERRVINRNQPMNLFPQLKQNPNKVDLLVQFCIQHAGNLNQVEAEIVGAEALINQPNQPINATPNSTRPSFNGKANILMQIIGGVVAILGAVAVALAFTVLNAATFGIAGLVAAGLGVAATLTGIGLFAAGTVKKTQAPTEVLLEDTALSTSISA